ncbi:hypothetical protein ACFL3C_00755 [Patescibacteria group bacterium]
MDVRNRSIRKLAHHGDLGRVPNVDKEVSAVGIRTPCGNPDLKGLPDSDVHLPILLALHRLLDVRTLGPLHDFYVCT